MPVPVFEQVGSGEVFSIAEEEPSGGRGGGRRGEGQRGGGGGLGVDRAGGGKLKKEETEVLLSPR